MSDYFTRSKWAQKYAKKAMPILVNLAESEETVTYGDLSEQLLRNRKHARTLPAALGRLGEALDSLRRAEPKKFGNVPPIQLLACNQNTERPGNRAFGFLGIKKADADRMPEQALDSLWWGIREDIYKYPGWHEVLSALDLKPLTLRVPKTQTVIKEIRNIECSAKGEGKEHKRLKVFIARNPGRVGLEWDRTGETEQFLLSGDRLDISFRNDERWIAVEVKPKQSPEADLIRGIFQCVKYKAILTAQTRYERLSGEGDSPQKAVQVILACGGSLPKGIRVLAEWLDVNTKTDISVPEDFNEEPWAKFAGSIKVGPSDLSSRKGFSRE